MSTNEPNDQNLDEVLAEVIRAEEAGQPINREQLLAKHPHLAEKLTEFFRDRDGIKELVDPLRDVAARALQVSCPHCHNPIELLDDAPLEEISCPSCGSSFSLVGSIEETQDRSIGKTIGHFELLDHVGIGQFGSVFKALDTKLDRTVAVKIPRHGQLGATQTEMFLRDARAAAQLKHPNIVGVHEVGKQDDTIYIVSDFIQGATLKEWMAAKRLTPREAAELCIKIANALHHAHEAGVIHRDLKPGNIMIERVESQGSSDESKPSSCVLDSRPSSLDSLEPHIVDFGLAKREAGEITMTVEGQILGTPAYMSPEQARGEGHTVDCRADIYSLGVILFELLTGELPFRGDKQMLIVQILQDDAPTPRKLNGSVPRELEIICLKCLGKEPGKRYGSAALLADDLSRYLSDRPILARSAGLMEKAIKWARRKPAKAGLVVVSSLAAIVFVAGLMVSNWLITQKQKETNDALWQVTLEKENTKSALDQVKTEQQKTARALQQVTAKQKETEEALRLSYLAEAKARRRSGEVGQRFKSLRVLEKAAAIRSSVEQRNEALACLALVDLRLVKKMEESSAFAFPEMFDLDPEFKHYVRAEGGDRATVRQISDHSVIANVKGFGKKSDNMDAAHFGPHGRFLAGMRITRGHSQGSEVRFSVWDLSTNQRIVEKTYRAIRLSIAFSPNSKRLAVGHQDGSVNLFRLPTGEEEDSISVGVARDGLCFDPTGKKLAIAEFQTNEIHIWETESKLKATTLTLPADGSDMAWRPDGKYLAVLCRNHKVYVWNMDDTKLHKVFKGHPKSYAGVAYHPTDNVLVCWGDTTVFWDPISGEELLRAEGTFRRFSQDGQYLALHIGRRFEVYEYYGRNHCRFLYGHYGVPLHDWGSSSIAFHPNGCVMATSCGKDGVRLYQLPSMNEIGKISLPDTCSVLFHPSGNNLVTSSTNGILQWPVVWSQNSSATALRVGPPVSLAPFGATADFSADGRLLAAEQWPASIIAIETGNASKTIFKGHSGARFVSVSANGTRVAVGGLSGTVGVYDTSSGQLERRLPVNTRVKPLFCPDDRWLITGTGYEYVVWKVATWERIHSVRRTTNISRPAAMAFTSDGRFVALATSDSQISILGTETWAEIGTIPAPEYHPVMTMQFNQDGNWLALLAQDGIVRMWNLQSAATELEQVGLNWNLPHTDSDDSIETAPLTLDIRTGGTDDTSNTRQMESK